jgi:hypothetical protein
MKPTHDESSSPIRNAGLFDLWMEMKSGKRKRLIGNRRGAE